MEKKIIIIGMLILILLIGGSYKPLIYKIFNDYEEECYEHEWYNFTYCPCGEFNFTFNNKTKVVCMCGGGFNSITGWETVRLPNESNCLKYHLVREVKPQ
jgi:hypothetical protein